MLLFLAAWLACSLTEAAPVAVSSVEPTAHEYAQTIRPLLEAHCFKCHDAKKSKGSVDFSKIQDNLSILRSRKVWRKSIAQLESFEMPPKASRQLSPKERDHLVNWLKQTVSTVDRTSPASRDPGPALIRRLSLVEYDNTIRDLFGFEFNSAESVGMPDDSGEGNSFGNLAAALDIPPTLLDKYFAAADKILDRFFGTELSSNVDGNLQERARMSREKLFGQKPYWRNPNQEVKPFEGLTERESARKIVSGFARRAYRRPVEANDVESLLKLYDRATGKGVNYVGGVRLMLKAVLVSPKFLYRIEKDQDSTVGDEACRVDDHELASRLSYFIWSSMPDEILLDLADRHKLTAPEPSAAPTKFGGKIIGVPAQRDRRGEELDKAFDGDIGTFYEGPGKPNTWVGLDLHQPRKVTLIKYAVRASHGDHMVGGKFQAADSADFSANVLDLFTIEKKVPDGMLEREIALPRDYRYFRFLAFKDSRAYLAEMELWGSAAGTVFEQQVLRMLDDPKARSLTHDFASNWLQIRKLPAARPSTEFFPEFQPDIRQAMFDETSLCFDLLRQENRNVLELLDADYTYLNEDLAKYYKIPDVKGKEMRQVKLKPEYHRGGLLGMGGILALTSHTSRTSPTMRGKWILEVIFGTPPPPPPANASMFQEEKDKNKEPKNFREKLALHASQTSCASCHKRMDPLGFALENYSAAGVWREMDGKQPIDASGILPTGEKFNGVQELKTIIRKRQSEFVHNLTEQMLTYAMGRELDYYDDVPVHDIQVALEKEEYRFATLVMGIVKSRPFQYRRNIAQNKPQGLPSSAR